MGNNLFGANISGQIAAALGPQLLTGTLVKTTNGSRGSDPTEPPPKTPTNHTFKGFKDTMDRLRPGTAIEDATAIIVILGDTISPAEVPDAGDQITLEGVTSRILKTDRDPDAAAYTCQIA